MVIVEDDLADYASRRIGTLKPTYRLFLVSDDDSVRCSCPIEAGDDAEALAKAAALTGGCAWELWDGVRFVEGIEHRPPAQDPLVADDGRSR